MPNRYKLVVGGGTGGGVESLSLAGLVAGACGFTLRRLEFSFVHQAYSSNTFWGEFDLVRGGTVINPQTPKTIFPVEQGNLVSPLTLAYTAIGQSSPQVIWSCVTGDGRFLVADFEGPNGITVLPSDTLAFSFTNSTDTDSCLVNGNLWFEE